MNVCDIVRKYLDIYILHYLYERMCLYMYILYIKLCIYVYAIFNEYITYLQSYNNYLEKLFLCTHYEYLVLKIEIYTYLLYLIHFCTF